MLRVIKEREKTNTNIAAFDFRALVSQDEAVGNEERIEGKSYNFSMIDFEDEIKKEGLEKEDKSLKDISPEEALIEAAKLEAEKIINEAKLEKEIIKEEIYQEVYKEAYEKGMKEGFKNGKNEAVAKMDLSYQEELISFKDKVETQIMDLEYQKQKLLDNYLDDLTNIAIAIGEKIVYASLKDTTEVVKRMILAASTTMKKTSWVKVYIGKSDSSINIKGDKEFLEQLSKITDQVKVIFLEEDDTYIIESPDGIIDLSIKSQMEHIKDVLNKSR